MAEAKIKSKTGNATVIKTGHTATSGFGANPDAKRRGSGGAVREIDFK